MLSRHCALGGRENVSHGIVFFTVTVTWVIFDSRNHGKLITIIKLSAIRIGQ